MSVIRRSGRFGAVAALTVLLAAVAPGAVTALTPPTFEVELYDQCFGFHGGPTNTNIDIAVRTSQGELMGTTWFTTDGLGDGFGCISEQLIPGLRMVAKFGVGGVHDFTLPNLTLRTNRVTDVVFGKAPPNANLRVKLHTNHTINPQLDIAQLINANASGNYSADFTSFRNMKGDDFVTTEFENAAGDVASLGAPVPFMRLNVRSARFDAWIDQYQTGTFQLKTAVGTLRATASDRSDEEGELEGLFWENASGTRILSAVGDKVSANFATDANLTIPNLSVVVNASTNVVSGVCLPNRRYWISVDGPSGGGFRIGNAASNGSYSEDFDSGSPYDIQVGDRADVTCQFLSGDQVIRRNRAT